MAEIHRLFIPFGEWRPDAGYIANENLRVAANVVPLHGDYIAHPQTVDLSAALSGSVHGLEVSTYDGSGYVLTNSGAAADLSEITDAGVITNRTRTAAGNYAAAVNFQDGCSFGDSVICTVFSTSAPASTEPVQYRAAGAARFANMITSTFEPRAKFCFPFQNNLFLAHCYVPGAFDTLAVGHHPRLVAWSQSENIRQFGSRKVTPELTGCGYQELNFDIGDIVDGVGGADYAIIGMEDGLVRVDGPPYTFRVVARGRGLVQPGALTIVGGDVFYVSQGGLARLRDGLGEPEVVGGGKFARWLADVNRLNASEFIFPFDTTSPMSLTHDSVNGLLLFAYKVADAGQKINLWYNPTENRASFTYHAAGLDVTRFVRARKAGTSSVWSPGIHFRFITDTNKYARFGSAGNSGLDIKLFRGLVQPAPNAVTRIRRVRPVFRGFGLASYMTLSVVSYVDPNGAGTARPGAALDPHGYITTPTAVYGDFHDLQLTVSAAGGIQLITEFTGLDVEYEVGGPYGA